MAVAVGGSNGLIDRLLALVDWKVTSTTTDQERVDCLNAINFCEQLIAQSESLLYLRTETSVTLPNGQDYVAVPTSPALDTGKDIVIQPVSGEGIIEYRPPDKFAAIRISTAYAITSEPAYYTIVRDHTASELRFIFKPSNASGSGIVLPLIAQRVPPALTDSGSSYSALPEGYELTLLLPMAEEYIKSKRNEFGIESLSAALGSRLEEFYNKQRDNKEKATTDRGRERRKVDVTVADEGY